MHAHVIPDTLQQSGEEDGARLPHVELVETNPSARVLVGERSRFNASEVWHSPQRRLEAMHEQGVDAEVVSPMPLLLDYSFPRLAGLDLSRRVNEYVARLCATSPGQLHGLGIVPMQDPDLAAKELPNLAMSGLRGIEVSSNVNGISIGDERFFDFFAEVESRKLAVFVHALNPTMTDRMPGNAAATYALGAEQTAAVASVACGGLTERCPNLKLAFSHGGGGFPMLIPRAHYFWAKRWNEEPPDEVPVDAEDAPIPSPYEQARRYYYDALLFDRRVLRMAIDILGPDRILVGTDFPAMEREQPAGHSLLSMGLAPDVIDRITWQNCHEFLGLTPAEG